jgi:integrase
MTRNALSEKSRDPEHTISDRDTKRTYKASIKRFCTWTKENGYTREDVLSNPQPYLQQYTDNLKAHGLSAATIHTYIAPCCKGLNTPMQHISKPDRAIGAITRSRGGKNPRGRKDAEKPEYARLVAFQEAVGLRRAELAHLQGKDLQKRDGVLYVHVQSGKGGKEQWQKILPRDAGIVAETFKGIGKDERVFSVDEMKNRIDLHGMRAAHARQTYDYYLTRIKQEPDYRSQLQENLKAYFREHHDPNGELDQAAYNRFCLDMTRNQGIYQMRGEAKKLAEANERPTTYDRVALMAVSTLHLAHWRLDVTITNYLSYKV